MSLRDQITGVLNRYSIDYGSYGVNANFKQWEDSKSNLIHLLRKHPNWNEDAMAIIFDMTESRDIRRYDVVNYMRDVSELSNDMEMTPIERENLYMALYAACDDCTKTISRDHVVNKVKEYSGVNCVIGQKTSKVVNAICKKFGIDKHVDYNKHYAKLADSLNPLQVKKRALLSVHPCDYLEMSSDRSSWNSCHRIDGGEYQAGTLSYMNDSTTMIFYTVDDDVKTSFYDAPKRTRQVFAYGDGILMQSRLYPSGNDTTITNYRNIVQKAIALCADEPNYWTFNKEQESVNEYTETHRDALHYRDYEHDWANISLLKSIDTVNMTITVGNTAYCVECGDDISEAGSLHCDNCAEDRYCCCECNDRIDEDDACWVNGNSYCTDCVNYCENCHEHFTDDCYTVYTVQNNRGYNIQVCERCAQEDYYYCEGCHEYYHPDNTHYTDNGAYCDDCYDDRFVRCDNCCDDVDKDDAEEIDGEYYCESCADDMRAELEDEDDEEEAA